MLIRQQAFSGVQNRFLKGGLHCHTTRSDGKLTPEETIRLHAENGYDFLALTDHRFYNYENYAPDTGVLIVPGMEIDANLTTRAGMCFHTVAIGPQADKNGYAQDERVSSARISCQEEFQPMVDEVRARNNLAFYCHPDWSRTPARSFEKLEGYFAMEIWNSGCVLEDDMDKDNGLVWDELLVQDKRINCVAVDDGHKKEHHCKGWVMVNAEKDLDAILGALAEGRYYSSCGPEIYDFYVEDGTAYCRCSPCAKIIFKYGLRPTPIRFSPDGGLITEASLGVKGYSYVRLVVEDEKGRRAWANPIYL
ncbi:MAG: hypothetical protein J6U63_02000 [Clostridia bacterium]|nr:hypothetical protein [Clostridia bacterium]